MSLDKVCTDRLTSLVDNAAGEVAAMFGPFVELDDIRQVMWLWIMEHEDTVHQLAAGSGWTLRRRLKDAAIKYGRAEKAAKSGYHPDDQYHYSLPTLVQLLPDAFDRYSTPPRTGPAEGSPSGEKTYSVWETQLADVRVALDRLSYTHFSALRQLVAQTREPNDALVRAALVALQSRLGGPR